MLEEAECPYCQRETISVSDIQSDGGGGAEGHGQCLSCGAHFAVFFALTFEGLEAA